jgi:hypothetical protein
MGEIGRLDVIVKEKEGAMEKERAGIMEMQARDQAARQEVEA